MTVIPSQFWRAVGSIGAVHATNQESDDDADEPTPFPFAYQAILYFLGGGASVERRLTTIMAADLVGYSRLMAADEEGTISRLRDARTYVIDPAFMEGGGRIVKTMGDG